MARKAIFTHNKCLDANLDSVGRTRVIIGTEKSDFLDTTSYVLSSFLVWFCLYIMLIIGSVFIIGVGVYSFIRWYGRSGNEFRRHIRELHIQAHAQNN